MERWRSGVALLREHAFLGSIPIWTDTGTTNFYFRAMPNASR